MDEYINKKKELLEEIKNIDTVNKVALEMINIHKEILSKKESLLNDTSFAKYKKRLNEAEKLVDECEVKHIEKEQICPFSQQKIINPFRNVCNHVYEREGLEKYVDNKSTVCPSLGCHTIVRLK